MQMGLFNSFVVDFIYINFLFYYYLVKMLVIEAFPNPLKNISLVGIQEKK